MVVQVNWNELSGNGILVNYSTSSLAGQPQFFYQDAVQSKQFSGQEIQTVDSVLGKLVTVFLVRTIDTGSTTFTVGAAGSLTVTVMEVQSNGNLVIQGEKTLKLNQGDEFVRVSGVVRRADIATDNTVTSDKVADAHISYSGRGVIDSSNRMGWLARFFNSGYAPY